MCGVTVKNGNTPVYTIRNNIPAHSYARAANADPVLVAMADRVANGGALYAARFEIDPVIVAMADRVAANDDVALGRRAAIVADVNRLRRTVDGVALDADVFTVTNRNANTISL